MVALDKQKTLILNKNLSLPARGIICAHPGRTQRIAETFLSNVQKHTDYRGFQVYIGEHQGQSVFVANTGIGAPAAAFILEELISFGARRILRLGSNDASFHGFKLKVVEETTLPLGLQLDYRFTEADSVMISISLKNIVTDLADRNNIPIEFTINRHIDGYFPLNRSDKTNESRQSRYTSQDMESGALYLLAKIYQIECLSLLISYPKHETSGEYCDAGQTLAFEGRAIDFALNLLTGD